LSGRDEIGLAIERIDPKIGGVMIMGDRGTGKSTTIGHWLICCHKSQSLPMTLQQPP